MALFLFLGSKKGQLPPILDPLLLEPATVLAARIRSKQLKSEDVVRAYIQRIRQVHPIINAVVADRFHEALEEAREVDRYLQNCDKSEMELAAEKPFLGVPFTSKQIIAVKGMPLDGGLVRRKGQKAQMDSDAVAQMRNSGAIPLAVTNLPEMSIGFECVNAVYGRTKNPYDLTKTPGGSSGGECALQTSAGSVLGLGNDLAGSLRLPAFFCGIFSHKPSRGIVSNSLQYPAIEKVNLNRYLATGPICRYAQDLLPALQVLAGERISLLQLDKKVDLKEVSVYYLEDLDVVSISSPVQTELKLAVKKVVDHLKKNYDVTAKAITIPELKYSTFLLGMKLVTEQTESVDRLLTGGKGSGINGLIEFFKLLFGMSEHTIHSLYYLFQSRVFSSFPQEIVDLVNQTSSQLDATFLQLLGEKGIFVYPTYPELYLYQGEEVMKAQNFSWTSAFNLVGLPVTQCPVGVSRKGYPLGVQIVGNMYQDHVTLAVARELETAFGGWKSPSKTTVPRII